MVADAAEVAGAGEGAAGLFPAVAVSFEQTLRGEDILFGPRTFEEGAAVDLLPLALEFDGAGGFRGEESGQRRRGGQSVSRGHHSGGGNNSVVKVAYGDYSGDAGGLQRIGKAVQARHGDAAAVTAASADL